VIYGLASRTGRMETEGLSGHVLPKHTRSVRLFCTIDASAFAAVMFALVAVMMVVESAPHHGFGPDLPHVSHAVSMSRANREDAMVIAVMRDGSVYFGRDKVSPRQLPSKILDRLQDHTVEPRIYIRADARVWYGMVKEVLDAVRSAGIESIAFLVNQSRPATPER
jgi:biopolymer transport protein TolR